MDKAVERTVPTLRCGAFVGAHIGWTCVARSTGEPSFKKRNANMANDSLPRTGEID